MVEKEMATFQWYGTNATSFTLAGHEVAAGSNRLLLVVAGFQRNVATDFSIDSMTFNGDALTSLVELTNTMTSRWYRMGVWYRLYGNSQTADTGSLVATASTTLAGASLCAVTLAGVDQSGPCPEFDADTSVPTALTLGPQGDGRAGHYTFWAAMASAGGTYTWSASSSEITPGEVYDHGPAGADSTEMASGGYDYIWPGTDGVANVTIQRGTNPTVQLGVAVRVRAGRYSLMPWRARPIHTRF